MIDFYPLEAEESIKRILAMDWERLIPGHPGAGGRLGTKKDVQDQLTFLQDASEAVKAAAREGKCWDAGGEGSEAAEVRELAGLREQPAVRAAPLLRPVGTRDLKQKRYPAPFTDSANMRAERLGDGNTVL